MELCGRKHRMYKVVTHSKERKEPVQKRLLKWRPNEGDLIGRSLFFFNSEDLYLSPRLSLKLWDVRCRLSTSVRAPPSGRGLRATRPLTPHEPT